MASQKSHKRLALYIVFGLVIGALIILNAGVLKTRPVVKEAKIDGMYLPEAQTISDFTLTDNAGQTFTKDSLQGHWTLMFFGFTNCGMVCPTTMSALNQMYQTLSKELPKEMLPQVVMVSVDPERDTVKRMNEYVTAFNPHFIGARADMAQIDAMEKQLHLVSVKMQADGGKDHYTIDHSAEIIVFNPKGELQAFMSYPHKADQMVRDYKSLLATSTL